jgi:hypothetical protein
MAKPRLASAVKEAILKKQQDHISKAFNNPICHGRAQVASGRDHHNMERSMTSRLSLCVVALCSRGEAVLPDLTWDQGNPYYTLRYDSHDHTN